MAVSGVTVANATPAAARRVGVAASVRLFARLKLRMLGNGLRGQSWRVALFVLGCLFGLWAAAMGFALFALPGIAPADADRGDLAIVVVALGGAMLVIGWFLLPLVFFGIDETLDPARFALLPLPRRALVAGQLAAGMVGIPGAATLLATAGTVVTAARTGGALAGAVQAAGVVSGLLLCLTLSRAVTGAFAGMLRSRRMRDLAAILLALLAALLGPLQIAVMVLLRNAELDRMVETARVVAWTPFAAPYTAGLDVADGRPLAAVVKLGGTLALTAVVLWWWSASLESAMAGTTASGARAGDAAGVTPVAGLFPWVARWAPRNQYGALVAREVRYWWRDARRRAGLITIVVVGVFVPVMFNLGGPLLDDAQRSASPVAVTVSMIFIGTLGALSLANQFGYDGSAYAAHVAIGVRGPAELAARTVAFSLYMLPLLAGIAVLLAVVLDRPALLPTMLGSLIAAYGAGLAINLFTSVLGAYALPETANPFAISTGAGMARSLLSFAALAGSLAAAVPFLLGAALLGDVWPFLALPLGLLYGVGAAALGCYIAGDLLDRRAPELLQTVTPRR